MFNPLSLRLCCLATMAPALTSEAATRTRDKLPGATTPPIAQLPLVNGRDCQGVSVSSPPTTGSHLVSFTKEIQRKLAGANDCSLQVSEPKKSSQISIVDLGTIANISEIYRSSASVLTSQQLNQLRNNLTSSSMASKTPVDPTSSTAWTAPSNGMTNTTSSHPMTPIQTKMAPSGTTPSALQSKPAASKTNMISDPRVHRVSSTQAGPSTVPQSTSFTSSEKQPQSSKELSNGFHTLSQKLPKSEISRTQLSTTNPVATTSRLDQTIHDQKQPLVTGTNHRKVTSSMSNMYSTNQMLETVARRQRQLEMKTGRLLRQLRRLQSRQAISHTKQQLSGLVEHEKQALQCAGKPRANSMDLKTELMQRQNAKNMSTAALVSLIQKWQCTQTTSLRQQLASTSQEPAPTTKLDEETCSELDRVSGHLSCNLAHLQSGMDSDATESSSGGESGDEWDYDDDFDGDESLQRPPLQCRAEWQWSSDRAAVAARWTWLQAQVSDLEYRIRQQYDIYKQIRASKGSVVLGDQVMPSEDLLTKGSQNDKVALKKLTPVDGKIFSLQAKNEMSPSNVSTLLSNVDKQSSRMSQQMGPLYTPLPSPSASSSSGSCAPTPKTPNGFVDSKSLYTPPNDPSGTSHVRTSGFEPNSPAPDHTCVAARCRPVMSYRKRKLLRTAGLHTVSRKAARLSTVQCHCFPPMTPCAMCGGRYNNTLHMEAETMPDMEKHALVDFSFHPVLSFPQDAALTTHFESMLKTGEWQKPHPRTYKVLQTERKRAKVKDPIRKYQRKLKKSQSATILSSAKIRNKYEQKQGRAAGSLPGSPVKTSAGPERTKLSRAEVRMRNRKNDLENLSQKGADGTVGKDTTSPGALPSVKDIWLRKKRERERGENAYDINNIVIPYSIAASTRVEKLQYKEILTPKWREVSEVPAKVERSKSLPDEPVTKLEPDTPEVVLEKEAPPLPVAEPEVKPEDSSESNQEIEDLSDEAFAARHLSCEISEKKRFSIPASATALRRSRGAQRTDSVASLSQLDPSSPLETPTGDVSLVSHHPTPPATPVPVSVTPATTEEGEELKRRDSVASIADMRTRSSSVSSSKSVRSRSTSHSEERPRDFPWVAPWPSRKFPLAPEDFQILESDSAPPLIMVKHPAQKRDKGYTAKVITEEMSLTSDGRPTSPMPGSESGSEAVEEDPDDPEWTVISERAVSTKHPNLVLKLSKR